MQEGRTKNSIYNIGFNMVNQILNLVLAFISRTVFVSVLGAEFLGINGLFSDVLGLLAMADLGFGTAMVYSFYKPLAEKNYNKMAALTSFYRNVYRVIASAVFLLGIAVTPFLQYIVNVEQEIPHLKLYYIISLLGVVVSYICVYKTSVLTADQKNYQVVQVTMFVNIFRTVLQIITLILFQNYILFLSIGVASNLATNLFASHVATKKYTFITNEGTLNKTEKREIFSNIGSMFLYKVSGVLLNATDNLLISVLVGTVAVGYYSNYLMVQNKIIGIVSLVFTSLTASIGNLIVKETVGKRFEIFQCEQVVSFLLSGIIVPCYVSLINNLVYVWLGEDYMLSGQIALVTGLNLYLSSVLQPLWSYREATGLYRKTKWVMCICAFINIFLSIVLGKIIGIAGIMLASALARIMTYVWYEPNILFREYFAQSPIKYFLEILKNLLLVVGLTFLVMGISQIWMAKSWRMLFAKAAIIGIFCLFSVVLFYHKSRSFTLIKGILTSKLLKKKVK